MGADGSKVAVPSYWPPSGSFPAEWPPSDGEEAQEATDQVGVGDEVGGTVDAEPDAGAVPTEEAAGQGTEPTEETGGTQGAGRDALDEGEDASSRYSTVEMEEGPVVTDEEADETIGPVADEPNVISLTGLTGAELGLLADAEPLDRLTGSAEDTTGAPGEAAGVIRSDLPMPPPPDDDRESMISAESAGPPSDLVDVIPITIPMPRPDVDEVSSVSDETDDVDETAVVTEVGEPSRTVGVTAADVAPPTSVEEVGDDERDDEDVESADSPLGASFGLVSSLPEPSILEVLDDEKVLEDAASAIEVGESPVEMVSTLPLPIPGPATLDGLDAEPEALEEATPVAEVGESPVEMVSALPLPLPEPATLDGLDDDEPYDVEAVRSDQAELELNEQVEEVPSEEDDELAP
jgi:hypothetical protein